MQLTLFYMRFKQPRKYFFTHRNDYGKICKGRPYLPISELQQIEKDRELVDKIAVSGFDKWYWNGKL